MSIKTGAKSRGVAFVQGSAWGTAVAVGSGRGIRTTSFSDPPSPGHEPLPREHIGDAYEGDMDKGGQSRTYTTTHDLYYGGNCGELLAYIFGTSGAPTDNTGSYTHAITMADALAKFATWVADKGGSGTVPWEYASAMARRMTISGEGQGRVTVEIEWLGDALSTASSTNTSTEMDAVTLVAVNGGAVKHTDGVFRVNAQGGAGLASPTDDIAVSRWAVIIERPLSLDFLTGSANIAQPCEENVAATVRVEFTLRSYTDTTWVDYWNGSSAPVELKADMTYSSGFTPSGGLEMTYLFQFPRLILAEEPPAPIPGKDRIPHTIVMMGLEAASAPTGMSGITKPAHAVVEDEDSGAYLA